MKAFAFQSFVLSLLIFSHVAQAEECDCERHKAGASGWGACSISESESWCQAAFYPSERSAQIAFSLLDEEKAVKSIGNIMKKSPRGTVVENSLLTVDALLNFDNDDVKGRYSNVTERSLVNAILVFAAFSGASSDPKKSDNVLPKFAVTIFSLADLEDTANQLSDQDNTLVLREFMSNNDLAIGELPVQLQNGLRIYVARGCFEIREEANRVRAMVQAEGAPAGQSCWAGGG